MDLFSYMLEAEIALLNSHKRCLVEDVLSEIKELELYTVQFINGKFKQITGIEVKKSMHIVLYIYLRNY